MNKTACWVTFGIVILIIIIYISKKAKNTFVCAGCSANHFDVIPRFYGHPDVDVSAMADNVWNPPAGYPRHDLVQDPSYYGVLNSPYTPEYINQVAPAAQRGGWTAGKQGINRSA